MDGVMDYVPSWMGGTKWATQEQLMAAQSQATGVLQQAAALRADVGRIQEPAKSQHSGHYLNIINDVERQATTVRNALLANPKMTEAMAVAYGTNVNALASALSPVASLISQDLSVPSGEVANQLIKQNWEATKTASAAAAKEAMKYDDPWAYAIDKLKQVGKDVGGVAQSWSWEGFKTMGPWLAVGGVVVGVWLFGPAIKAALAARQARKGIGPLPPFGGIG